MPYFGLNWTVAGTLQHQRSALDVAIPIAGAPFRLHFSYKTTFRRVQLHWPLVSGRSPVSRPLEIFKKIANDRRCILMHSGDITFSIVIHNFQVFNRSRGLKEGSALTLDGLTKK